MMLEPERVSKEVVFRGCDIVACQGGSVLGDRGRQDFLLRNERKEDGLPLVIDFSRGLRKTEFSA